MDPDLVRQQEEAEAASRLRKIVTAQAPFIRSGDKEEDKFVLRAEPRDVPEPAPQPAPRRKRPPGLGAALRATFLCLGLTIVGLVGGIMLGVKLGLVSWQSLGLGMVAGYGFGWRAAVASLRGRYDLSRTKAYRAPLVPAFIILLSLVAALGIVLPFASSALDNGQSSQLLLAWLISLLAGSVAAFALALPKMQNNLRG